MVPRFQSWCGNRFLSTIKYGGKSVWSHFVTSRLHLTIRAFCKTPECNEEKWLEMHLRATKNSPNTESEAGRSYTQELKAAAESAREAPTLACPQQQGAQERRACDCYPPHGRFPNFCFFWEEVVTCFSFFFLVFFCFAWWWSGESGGERSLLSSFNAPKLCALLFLSLPVSLALALSLSLSPPLSPSDTHMHTEIWCCWYSLLGWYMCTKGDPPPPHHTRTHTHIPLLSLSVRTCLTNRVWFCRGPQDFFLFFRELKVIWSWRSVTQSESRSVPSRQTN